MTLGAARKMDLLIGARSSLRFGAVLFWYSLPRGGKTHRFVRTELEPYVAVAFCAAVALSFTFDVIGCDRPYGRSLAANAESTNVIQDLLIGIVALIIAAGLF